MQRPDPVGPEEQRPAWATEEQGDDDRRHRHDVHELGEVEEREPDRRVLGVEAADDLLLGLDEVERRPVELGRRGDEEDHERHDAGGDEVPVDEAVLDDDHAVRRERAADEHDGRDREAERRLVGDHLRRRPHRADERVLRARRPAGEHHAVHRDRRHREHEQDADRRIGHLQVGLVPEDLDDAVVAVLEDAADRARRRTMTNAGTIASSGARRKTNGSDRSGSRSSLKNSLMPSASVCSTPHGPAMFGPTRFCMSAMSLRSNQIISITPTSSSDEREHDLERDDQHDREVDVALQQRIAADLRRARAITASPPARR